MAGKADHRTACCAWSGKHQSPSQPINPQGGGRLDLLAEDKENQYRYAIELMLGKLDKSHIVRAIDYWLREKARAKGDDWQPVAVIVAEDIRNSKWFNVVRFLTEKMPMVVVEIRALKVGKNLTVTCSTLLDGRDE